MIEFGNVVAVLAASFGLGIFWYEFLRRPQKDRYRVTAISFVGVLIGEGLVSAGMVGGPAAYGLHPVTALIASFAAVYLHTSWTEKKALPWEIISDLDSLKGSVQSVSMPSVSVPKLTLVSSKGSSSEPAATGPAASQSKKAA